MYLSIYVYIYIYIHTYLYVSMYVSLSLSLSLYIYIYIYAYIYIYTVAYSCMCKGHPESEGDHKLVLLPGPSRQLPRRRQVPSHQHDEAGDNSYSINSSNI